MTTNTTVPLTLTQHVLARIDRAAEVSNAQMAQQRHTLAGLALDGSASDIVAMAQRLDSAEALLHVLLQARHVLTSFDALAFQEWLTEQALADPDDSWSGRGNDARRLRADARRDGLRQIARWAEVID